MARVSGTSFHQPRVLYANLRDGKFSDITARSGAALSELHSGRGLALGDLFNDGRIEALVNNMNETPSLYRNSKPVGNFISLQLSDANRIAPRWALRSPWKQGNQPARTGSSQWRRVHLAERSALAFWLGQCHNR